MYRRKIRWVAWLGATIVAGAAALAIWSVASTQHHLSQAKLANNLLAEHLQLSVRSYRLFKQLTDEVLLGTLANQAVARNKQAAIESSLAKIRYLELKQRDELGPVPGAVEDTDALEALIANIVANFEALHELPAGPERASRANAILEDQIDISFRESVNAALERQQGVVNRMDHQIGAVHTQLVGVSAALLILALVSAFAANRLLERGIARPLASLYEAARALGRGELNHRVPRGFDAEFEEMAMAFNSMAERLSEKEASREETRRDLEAAVEERTAALQDANASLQRSDAARRHFFADVSHELRTPLTVIRGEAQVALRASKRSEADYREALDAIHDQAVGLSRLVDDMLFVARSDARTIRLNRRRIDPAALTDDVFQALRNSAEGRSVALHCDVAEGSGRLSADPDRLRQLVMILLDNALRYGPAGSTVRVHWTPEERHWHLRVEDSGPGIDPQDLPHIFDRFFRGTSDDEGSGLGLGLAVAKAIVQAHDGEIRAESAAGIGTTMHVTLPATA